jgi:hypothetical protein
MARGKDRMARMGFGAWYTKAPWLVAGPSSPGNALLAAAVPGISRFGWDRLVFGGHGSLALVDPASWEVVERYVLTEKGHLHIDRIGSYITIVGHRQAVEARGALRRSAPHVVREPARTATPRSVAKPAAAPSRSVAFAPKRGKVATNQALFMPHPSPQLRKFPPRAPRHGFVAPLSTSFG